MDTSRNNEFSTVRRAYSGEKSFANGLTNVGRRSVATTSFCHFDDSRTPYRMKPTRSAGRPPTANIARQP
jgi:hypothetical protein